MKLNTLYLVALLLAPLAVLAELQEELSATRKRIFGTQRPCVRFADETWA